MRRLLLGVTTGRREEFDRLFRGGIAPLFLLRGAGALAGIPGVLINGRFDLQAPLGNAWELKRAWPRAELVVVDDAGHSANAALIGEVMRATDRQRGSAEVPGRGYDRWGGEW